MQTGVKFNVAVALAFGGSSAALLRGFGRNPGLEARVAAAAS
jgi:hypothetical protein